MSFTHDVFLSHSSADKPVVRDLANRLKNRGLRVWFDEWEIQPGDSIPDKVEAGLEGSGVLVLCMSANARDSEWARLESQTFLFRDPLNRERRFVPLRLDDAELRGSLEQFLYVDWRERDEENFEKLARACKTDLPDASVDDSEAPSLQAIPFARSDWVNALAYLPDGRRALSGCSDGTLRLWDLESGLCQQVFEGHLGSVRDVAVHPDGVRAISGSLDHTVRSWDLETGRCISALDTQAGPVFAVDYHPDGRGALVGTSDKALRLWDLETHSSEQVFEGHLGAVNCLACLPDGGHAITGSDDGDLRVWDLDTGACELVLADHRGLLRDPPVHDVACNPSGGSAISASSDCTLRIWNLKTGRTEHILLGHSEPVRSVAYRPDGQRALSGSNDQTMREWNLSDGSCERLFEGHNGAVLSLAYAADGTHAISGSDDHSMRVWDLSSDDCFSLQSGHTPPILAADFLPDQNRAVSGSSDGDVRVWNLEDGSCEHILVGHARRVTSVAFSSDGKRVISGSEDSTVRFWALDEGTSRRVVSSSSAPVLAVAIHPDSNGAVSGSSDGLVQSWSLGRESHDVPEMVMRGHAGAVNGVAVHPKGWFAASGSEDRSVRVWDLQTGEHLQTLLGHNGAINAVAFLPDGESIVSAGEDMTLRVWDTATGACERVLEGHTGAINTLAIHPDGTRVISGSSDCVARIWDLESGICETVLLGHAFAVVASAFHPDGRTILTTALNGVTGIWGLPNEAGDNPALREAQVTYSNAKVVLVGESQAGKSGLAMRLALDRWEHTNSTLGAWATQLRVPENAGAIDDQAADVGREIWLWDFGGQADQRLIHQLYLRDARLAVFVFDGQQEDAMPRLWDWNRALDSAGQGISKVLAAGRTDMYPVRIGRAQIEEFCDKAGFGSYFETSANTGIGCAELRESIVKSIDWSEVPQSTSPEVFRRLKKEILRLKAEDRALTTFKELRDWLSAEVGAFDSAQLDAVIDLLAGPGAVARLGFGDYVLLRPELLNTYAQCVIQSLRDDPDERGCITEERVLRGELEFPADFNHLPEADERIVLLAMHRQLVERSICLRDEDAEGKRPTLLVFPNYFRSERPDRPMWPQPFMSYQFDGHPDEVYASLVGRLHYSDPFQNTELWRNSADVIGPSGKDLGVRLITWDDGTGELRLHSDKLVPAEEQALFAKYVQNHLETMGSNVTRLRTYICPDCETPVENRDAAMKRLEAGKTDIGCSYCDNRVELVDQIEVQLADPTVLALAEKTRSGTDAAIDSESLERLLVAEASAIISKAGQIAREVFISDHGIDMEIEFKNDSGEATGKKVCLQLKSGDSHLRKRAHDKKRLFAIKKARHAEYWADQAFPVVLVIRDSVGNIEWMEIREILRKLRASEDEVWPARQLAFEGQRFDVATVRTWRDLALAE